MRKRLRKIAAAALAAMLAVQIVPATGMERTKAANEDGLTAYYDMSHSGNSLMDISGNDNHATLYGAEEKDFAESDGEKVLQFKNKQYATLPKGLVTGDDNDFTVEITLSTQSKAAHWAWCIGDGVGTWGSHNVGNYVFANPNASENSRSGQILSGIKVGNVEDNKEVRLPSPTKNLGAGYSTISVVGRGDKLTLYLDGEQVSETTHSYSMNDVIPGGNVLGYIGKSLFAPDALLTANVSRVRFYDKARSQEEIKSSLPSTQDKARMIAADAAKAMLGANASADQITSDLDFPATIDGVSMIWGESDNTDIVDTDGTVTAPTDQDTAVKIPLSFEVDGQAQNVELNVTVKQNSDPDANQGELVAAYDMTREGNRLQDVSGKNHHAELCDVEDEDFLTYDGQNVWQMKKKGYAVLPSGMIDGENFTMQATLSTQTQSAHWLFAVGDGMGNWNDKNVGDYIFVNPCANEKGGNFLAAIKTGTGVNWKESRMPDSNAGFGSASGYATVTLVGKGGKLSLYLNGQRVSSLTQDKTIQDVLAGKDITGYIGKSLYTNDPFLTANLAEVKIWSKALSKNEINAELPDGKAKKDMLLADLYEAVKGTNTSLDAVTEDLSFPGTVDNVAIAWGEPSNKEVIGTDGKINAVPEKESKVTIPLSFEIDGQAYNEEIAVTVLPLDVDGKLKEAVESLDIPNKMDVRGNITLPSETKNGVTVSWATDREDIVNVNEIPETVEGYGSTPAGTVTRPAADTVVRMTATLTLADKTVTKEIDIRVKGAPKTIEDSDYTDYFFAYFAGEKYDDGERIFFASSQDGLNWDDLNNNKSILTSDMGEKGVRDPFILRSPEGDKFYMIATDLNIHANGDWGAAQNSGSQALMVWESTDLVNWSDQRMVTVSASIGAGCTWAPEATYDELTGEYVVYWASRVPSIDGKQRLYYAKTRDFYTFTEPQLFIEKDESSIDTTILHEDGTYYRFTKNEGGSTNELGANTKSIFMEKSSQLLGTYSSIPSESLNSNQWVEGPAIFKFHQDDQANGKYCLLVDNFGGGGYYPLVCGDLESGEFSKPSSYKMPSRARHGTPIRVTSEEYSRVMQQWGGQEVDKTALKELVEAEKKVALEEKEYTKATWKEYKAALDEAEAIVKDDDATAAQVSAAMETLKSARAALVPANRKDLVELTQKTPDKQEGEYTKESWAAYQSALAMAREVLKNSQSAPSEIEDAIKALSAAFDGLKVKDNESGGSGGQDANNGGNGSSDGNGNSSGSGSGAGSGSDNGGKTTDGRGVAKTGDQANVAVPVMLAVGAAAVILAIIKRKKRA